MFEDSTFESRGSIRTRSRGWSLAAFVVNASVLVALVLIPLIHPEALPKQVMSLLLIAPPPPVAPQPAPEAPKQQAFHGAPEMVGLQLTAPRQIPSSIARFTGPEEAAPGTGVASMHLGPEVPGGVEIFRSAPAARVAPPARQAPTHISSGVAAGLLLQRTLPQYPAIAKAMHVEGTVVLQATISKTGTIENLRVVSGPPLLQAAAVDAVKSWLYRPYLLNGEPVEVETTVNVVFTLGR